MDHHSFALVSPYPPSSSPQLLSTPRKGIFLFIFFIYFFIYFFRILAFLGLGSPRAAHPFPQVFITPSLLDLAAFVATTGQPDSSRLSVPPTSLAFALHSPPWNTVLLFFPSPWRWRVHLVPKRLTPQTCHLLSFCGPSGLSWSPLHYQINPCTPHPALGGGCC